MMKTLESQNKNLKLSIKGECLQTLQKFAHPSKLGGEYQVRADLRRTYDLTIGNWSYQRPSDSSNVLIEPDREEVFFNSIKRLDKKLQEFILLNFHQGGMFHSARQFLTFHLISLGFNPSKFRHHFICDFDKSDELVITEKFNITTLDFVSDNKLLYKVTAEDEEFVFIDLKQADKDKIRFLQKEITELLGNKATSQHKSLKLEKKIEDKNVKTQLLYNSDEKLNLLELSVKHTLKLDSIASTGIKVKQLSKQDVEFKVQADFYNLNSSASEPTFAKLLSPNLQCVPSGFFKKPNLKSKLSEIIINNYQDFIIILFKILLNFCSPINLPEKASSLTQESLTEPQNSFAYRMRA